MICYGELEEDKRGLYIVGKGDCETKRKKTRSVHNCKK